MKTGNVKGDPRTKFGYHNDLKAMEKGKANRMHGFISEDEGYAFVSDELVRDSVVVLEKWKFYKDICMRKVFFLNLLESPSRSAYL